MTIPVTLTLTDAAPLARGSAPGSENVNLNVPRKMESAIYWRGPAKTEEAISSAALALASSSQNTNGYFLENRGGHFLENDRLYFHENVGGYFHLPGHGRRSLLERPVSGSIAAISTT